MHSRYLSKISNGLKQFFIDTFPPVTSRSKPVGRELELPVAAFLYFCEKFRLLCKDGFLTKVTDCLSCGYKQLTDAEHIPSREPSATKVIV